MGQNYGYETLMTELPSFMNQVLHFNLQDVSPNGKQPCSPCIMSFTTSFNTALISPIYITLKDRMMSD